jgi:hypothetical protein
MKLKALLIALFVAGLAASFALASPGSPTNSATTTTKKPKCDQVELKGTATAGSVTLTVAKANKRGRGLVNTSVTLVITANAKVKAKACSVGGVAPFTLRELHVSPAH